MRLKKARLSNGYSNRGQNLLYPTTNQIQMLLVLLFLGVASGILFDAFSCFVKLVANDKITKHFFNFLATFFSFFALFFANLRFNYGQFRLYLIFVFALGFAIEKTISKFLWTKLIKRCYIKKKGERSGQKKA